MNFSSLAFLIREGLLNIRRNGLMTLAALGTVSIALTVLGSSLWTAYRIHEIADQQPRRFNEVDVFLANSAPRSSALTLQDQIKALPGVGRVHLVTKEDAWSVFQVQEPTVAAGLTENPLPDKLEVQAQDPTHMDGLVSALRDRSRFHDIASVTDAGNEVKVMVGLSRLIRVLGGSIALGLFAATLFIVHNTVRLTVFARRREIRIMQLVGATPGFIRFPLLLEGLFHGFVGAAIACVIVLMCGRQVSDFVAQVKSPLITTSPSLLSTGDLIAALMMIGVFVGLLGSHLGMRRFLRQA